MIKESRKKYLLNLIDEKDFVKVSDIAKRFNVTKTTVRRDLNELEEKGFLIRKYGGAVKSEAITNIFAFDKRLKEMEKEKDEICRKAANFIENNDTVFIDCGTTLYKICKYIKNKKGLRIITNSLPVVSELINHKNINLNLIGGKIIHERKSVYGSMALRNLDEYHIHKSFIGANGLTIEDGLSSYDEQEGEITQKIIEKSSVNYLLCDSSKIGKNSFYMFSPITSIQNIITDDKVDEKIINKLKKLNINIIITNLKK
ncbi:MAG: hypothetical protein DRI44_10320 [Chlamydiae bacterium]|nr:MAG: hypothetical protein DRI44_10320 [Chlamydiota bacterium]